MNILGRCRSRRHGLAIASVALATAMVATSCGGSSTAGGPESGDGLPDEINIVSVNPTSGVVAFAGEGANRGYELAVAEINEQDFLEGTTINLTFKDSKSEPQAAAQEVSQVIADTDISAVFGSVSSQEAVAMSPLAQDKGMPIVYTQAGTEGVLLGEYTYRATPLMSDYYPLLSSFIEETGAKSLGIIYTEASPPLQTVADSTLPEMAEDLGIEITTQVGTQATTQDYRAPISQVLGTEPDLVAVLLSGASNPTAMTQLRQAGYDGPVLGNLGAGSGNLEPAGAAGAGMVWATDFMADMKAPSTQEFVEAYRAEYGEVPNNYSAEAYDAAWFMARVIKEAQSPAREDIKDAMGVVAQETFDGALGENLSWVDQQIVLPGAVVEYTEDGEKLLYEGSL